MYFLRNYIIITKALNFAILHILLLYIGNIILKKKRTTTYRDLMKMANLWVIIPDGEMNFVFKNNIDLMYY